MTVVDAFLCKAVRLRGPARVTKGEAVDDPMQRSREAGGGLRDRMTAVALVHVAEVKLVCPAR
ncbi:hypothetical protein [Oceaniovalibus sp. ACAM 378]|uniref:hypothetical protein n=1 Tax=Oceaniovalibus sp. ACAM 378 TaxID=2599923 RepID=UPI0011D99A91|nr:hypothetical protein [Oceaniovalibus sp. ACAM 378]TYB89154.1 hypothetical protein FQ320_09565 [Oceaniovalibus sp. ACAM 378]